MKNHLERWKNTQIIRYHSPAPRDLRISLVFYQNLACVASVSVGFGSKERPRNNRGTGFSVFCLRGKWGESQKNNGGGRGGEGKEPLADKPLDFENSVRWRTGLVIGWASRTFLTCVDQRS